jgi:UDP-2,3-diacylglucosamine pyrophosphatase LpxH
VSTEGRASQDSPSDAPSDAPPRARANLLVLSDLHIGQDLAGATRFSTLRGIARLDRELCAFLDFYANHPMGGRPWRLVLAGDVIDFMQVNLRPAGSVGRTRWHAFVMTPEEEVYGLGPGAERAVWKLERIVARHRRVFLAIGRFIAAGNEVCIVRGNHDDELHMDDVQAALRHLIAELFARANPSAPRLPVDARIQFFPWFYYEEGVAYVEHGHQFDPYSSFEYFLEPAESPGGAEDDQPLPALGARYFASRFPGFPSLEQDRWAIGDYVRWGFAQGFGVLRAVWLYVRLIFIVAASSWRRRRAHSNKRRWLARRLAELERFYGLPRAMLARLQALHARPVTQNLWRSLQVLFVDRVLVVLGTVGAAVSSFALPVAAATATGLCAAFVTLGAGVLWWLARLRDVTSDNAQAAAARAVARELAVKFVVMGHSHRPVVARTDHGRGAWYLNTGTWIPPIRRAAHAARCDCRLTHLAVIHGDSPELARAHLRRWCAEARRPEAMREVG